MFLLFIYFLVGGGGGGHNNPSTIPGKFKRTAEHSFLVESNLETQNTTQISSIMPNLSFDTLNLRF